MEHLEDIFENEIIQLSNEFTHRGLELHEQVNILGYLCLELSNKIFMDKRFGYKGVNYLVQGTSADIMSERMIEIHKYLENKKSNLLLQVHDEIICEVHKDEVQTVLPKIRDLLKTNTLDIPLDVDMEICSPSWATKKDASDLITTTTEQDWIEW